MFLVPLGAEVRVILQEGTVRAEGLPGFGPNMLASWRGVYRSPSGTEIAVFASREQLLFDPAIWKREQSGAYRAFRTGIERDGQVWCIERRVVMRDELKGESRWFFLVQSDGAVADSFVQSFVAVFVPKTEFFIGSLRRLEDLSFPAVLEIR